METLRNDVAISFRRRQLNVHGLMPRLGLRNEVGQTQVGIRSGHEVAVMVLQQVVLYTLGHAAQHADDQSAALLPFCMESFQPAENLLFGIVAHRASVQEDGICLFQGRTCVIAGHLHHGGNDFRVGHVHLTSVGFYIEFLHCLGTSQFGCKGTTFNQEIRIYTGKSHAHAHYEAAFAGQRTVAVK